MKVFLDTNVLIDFMAERQGYPAAAALSPNADVILTHKISDFHQSSLDVMTPEDFLEKYFA